MKKIALLVAAVLGLFGCGGQDDEGLYVYGQNAETYLVGARGGTAQYGWQTGAGNKLCLSTAPGQVCVIPKTKTIRVQISSASGAGVATAADIQAVRVKAGGGSGWFGSMVGAGLDVTAEPWSYAEGDGISSPTLTIVVDASAGGFCGSGDHSTNEITKYSCITFGGTTNLTEDAGVVGSYVKLNGTGVLHIDLGALRAKGATSTEDDNLLRHAVFSGMLRLAGGVGNNGTGNSRCSSSTINSLTKGSACLVNANEACIMSSFGELNDLNNFGIVSASGCGT